MELTSRPYLIRGIYDWVIDNHHTPYLLVDVSKMGVSVPMQYVDNGRIVLNIGPKAVNHMNMGKNKITFVARFNGQALDIVVPCQAVLAIFAKEIGQGMVFNDKSASTIEAPAKVATTHTHQTQTLRRPRPHLTLVK